MILANEMSINNINERTMDYRYIVCRAVDGDVWYYGADNDIEKAKKVAFSVDGFVIDKGEENRA